MSTPALGWPPEKGHPITPTVELLRNLAGDCMSFCDRLGECVGGGWMASDVAYDIESQGA